MNPGTWLLLLTAAAVITWAACWMHDRAQVNDTSHDDTLGFVDQPIYANEDNAPGAVWRNEEVLALLSDIRIRLHERAERHDG